MGSRRKMTDREMKATALNKKEDRVLQKTFGTLNLEMSFTYNVISLHVRTVKSNFRRLRDRVDKLKSHLTPEEITVLRQMEEEGKLRPATSFNVNAAMKIAAAARRLNLYPEGLNRSRSEMSSTRKGSNDKLLKGRSITDTNMLRKRSNSVTGVFIDAPSGDETVRRNSTDAPITVTFHPVGTAPPEPATDNASLKMPTVLRPQSAAQPTLAEVALAKKSAGALRPASSFCGDHEQESLLPKPSNVPQKQASEYGDLFSQSMSERVTEAGTGKVKKSPLDKMAMIDVNDEALDSGRTKIFEDRRQELLHDEQLYSRNLEKRKNTFIGKIDDYLIENPPVEFNNPTLPIDFAKNESDNEQIIAHSRRRRNYRQYDSNRTFTSEEEYNQRQGELWKDMNKTRYLRVPDDKLDMSGVVTLAKDQMQLYQLLRSTEPTHIVTH